MVRSDFEIPRSFIVENNCDIFKQASGNNPDKVRSTRGLKDAAKRIC